MIAGNYDDAVLQVACGELEICGCQAALLWAVKTTTLSDAAFARLLRWCCVFGSKAGAGGAGAGRGVPTVDLASTCTAATQQFICANTTALTAAGVALTALAAVNPVLSAPAKGLANILAALLATCSSGGKLSGADTASLCKALSPFLGTGVMASVIPDSLKPVVAGLQSCCQAGTPDPTTGLPWWTYLTDMLPLPSGWTPGAGGFPQLLGSLPGLLGGGGGQALPPGSSPPPQLPPPPSPRAGYEGAASNSAEDDGQADAAAADPGADPNAPQAGDRTGQGTDTGHAVASTVGGVAAGAACAYYIGTWAAMPCASVGGVVGGKVYDYAGEVWDYIF